MLKPTFKLRPQYIESLCSLHLYATQHEGGVKTEGVKEEALNKNAELWKGPKRLNLLSFYRWENWRPENEQMSRF